MAKKKATTIVGGMAEAIWAHVDQSYRGGTVPPAATKAADDLDKLFREVNRVPSLETLFSREIDAQYGEGHFDAESAEEHQHANAAQFGWNLAQAALDERQCRRSFGPRIKVPAFKVWLYDDFLQWEGAENWGEDIETMGFKRKNPPTFSVGDRVQSGTPGTAEYDHGKVMAVKHGRVEVYWEIAKEKYWEDPAELKPYTPRSPDMVPHAKTVQEVRAILAKTKRCSKGCKGWFVSDSDRYGLQIERCDDCAHLAPKELRLYDEDVQQLPEAKTELERTIAEGQDYEQNPARRQAKRNGAGLIGYNAKGKSIYGDDVQIDPKTAARFEPLRGYGHILAAFDAAGRCIGWVTADQLGYPDAKAWADATGWKES